METRLTVLVGLLCLCVAAVDLTEEAFKQYARDFESYQVKFNKHYDTQDEYNLRLRAYAENMEKIKEYHRKNPNSTMLLGETGLSDQLEEERSRFYGHIFDSTLNLSTRAIGRHDYFEQPRKAATHTRENMPQTYDWCNDIDCGQASNQGRCGSCWAFASIGALEMQLQLEGNKNYVQLSKQHPIDCATSDSKNYGCCGGYVDTVYSIFTEFQSEAANPYRYKDFQDKGDCHPNSCLVTPTVAKIRGYEAMFSMPSRELKELIWMYGPLYVGIHAPDSLSSYRGGIVECSRADVESTKNGHAVVAIGFGNGYIRMRNSWGADWGNSGNFDLSDSDYVRSCGALAEPGVNHLEYARPAAVPNSIDGWTCNPALYDNGKCDCECGIWDPDCEKSLNFEPNNCEEESGCIKDEQGNGKCISLQNWTCYPTKFMDGICDCNCGMWDPDCDTNKREIANGCGGTWNKCLKTQDGKPKCYDLTKWSCSEDKFGDGRCDCDCGAWDVDCEIDKQTVPNGCTGLAEKCALSKGGEPVCVNVLGWTCPWDKFADGRCDCNCGAWDTDCDFDTSEQANGCEGEKSKCTKNAYGSPVCHNLTNWYCPLEYFGDEECHCSCGAWDIDCDTYKNVTPRGCLFDHERCAKDQEGKPTCYNAYYWNCSWDKFLDGRCDCNCGRWDPDCDTDKSDVVRGCGTHIFSKCYNDLSLPRCYDLSMWMCTRDKFGDGQCDCTCGIWDVDCDKYDSDVNVTDCPGTYNKCHKTDKDKPVCYNLTGWECSPHEFGTGRYCNGYCGPLRDPACPDGAVRTAHWLSLVLCVLLLLHLV